MNSTLNKIVSFVTQKKSLQETTQKELQDLIQAHPYFAPTQLLYAAKLKQDKSFQLQTQIQKAGLYFTNPRWLQFQLLDVDHIETTKNINNEENITTNVIENSVIFENINTINLDSEIKEDVISDKFEDNKDTIILEKEPLINDAEKLDQNEVVASFMPNIAIPTATDVKNILNNIENKNSENFAEESLLLKEAEVSFSNIETKDIDEPIFTDESISVEHTIPINLNDNFKEEINDSDNSINENSNNSINDIHAEIAALKANWLKIHSNEYLMSQNNVSSEIDESKIEITNKIEEENFKNIDIENTQNTDITVEETSKKTNANHFNIPSSISNSLSSLKDSLNKPPSSFESEKFSFETEPYYTIDYFESQGIKFDYTKEPTDKLTTKMLKFTDWLKKMKNQKYEPTIKDDPELDQAIQTIAAASNENKEIVTETMAQVFVKQGKKEQAIQLYIKLSFLIPAKSSYFANQIKELKGI